MDNNEKKRRTRSHPPTRRLIQPNSVIGHSTVPPSPLHRPSSSHRQPALPNSITNPTHTQLRHSTQRNTYETRGGSHIVLEFADPTSSPGQQNAGATALAPGSASSPSHHQFPSVTHYHSQSSPHSFGSPRSATSSPTLSRQVSHAVSLTQTHSPVSPSTPDQGQGQPTRLQATFEAIKKMSTGLSSPRIDFATRRGTSAVAGGSGSGREDVGVARSPGYFDVVVDGEKA